MGNRVTVAAERRPCVGVGPQECLVVNGENFFDEIEGFEHQPGQSCRIRVRKTKIANPPADGSSERWTMVGKARCRRAQGNTRRGVD